MLARIPPEETGFFLCLLPLFPPLSRQACCFCFTSQNNSEVISFLRGRKHRPVLCSVNNKCSCPQALAQVVNKLVNYIDINAIGLELKLPSPRTASALPRLCPARRPVGGGCCGAPLQAAATVEVGVCSLWPAQGSAWLQTGGFKSHPLTQPFSQRLGHRDLGQPQALGCSPEDLAALVPAGRQ